MFAYGFGVNGISEFVAGDGFYDLPFAVAGTFVGTWLVNAMLILIVTSFFACLLAFHNASARYMFALGRERLLPNKLAVVAKSGAPVVANTVLIVIAGAAIIATILLNGDPYVNLAVGTYAAGTSGLVFAQAVASISVVAFFLKDRRGHSIWRVLILPVVGALGLSAGWLAIVTHYDLLTGWAGVGNTVLIVAAPALLVIGIVWALGIKARDSKSYEKLIVTE
jgi:amino acid transporter